MNLTNNPPIRSSLDPAKPLRQLPHTLRGDQMSNSNSKSRNNSQISIKISHVYTPNNSSVSESQRNRPITQCPLMFKDCFKSDLKDLTQEIETDHLKTSSCISMGVLRKIFTFLEVYFSDFEDFQKIIEILFESIFSNKYSEFLSQLNSKDLQTKPSDSKKSRGSFQGLFIPQKFSNRDTDAHLRNHSGRKKTTEKHISSKP